MDKDKLIELLKDAWNDGMSQYHDCKYQYQYKEDLENFIDNNEDEINELCGLGNVDASENTLHMHDVSITEGELCEICNQNEAKVIYKTCYKCEEYIINGEHN